MDIFNYFWKRTSSGGVTVEMAAEAVVVDGDLRPSVL